MNGTSSKLQHLFQCLEGFKLCITTKPSKSYYLQWLSLLSWVTCNNFTNSCRAFDGCTVTGVGQCAVIVGRAQRERQEVFSRTPHITAPYKRASTLLLLLISLCYNCSWGARECMRFDELRKMWRTSCKLNGDNLSLHMKLCERFWPEKGVADKQPAFYCKQIIAYLHNASIEK